MDKILEIAHKKLTTIAYDKSLVEYVLWLDQEYYQNKRPEGLPTQIITRSVVAVGLFLLDKVSLNDGQRKVISTTLDAASYYVLYPEERTWEYYFAMATNSFPYGHGLGCYCINDIKKVGARSCGPGSGCISGAGVLLSQNQDEKMLFQAISEELIPWIEDGEDPVLIREIAKT